MNFFVALTGRLLGIEDLKSIDHVTPSLAAPWAQNGMAWVLFGCLALTVLTVLYYIRYQTIKRRRWRIALTVLRAAVLSLLLIIIADPVLKVAMVSSPRPLLWVLLDGTESMAIEDELQNTERQRLAAAVELPLALAEAGKKVSRAEYVRCWLQKKEHNVLAGLQEKYRLQGFILDRPDGVRALDWAQPGTDILDPHRAAAAMTTSGQVTALGRAFDSLASRRTMSQLAGVVVISDFDQNAGPPPLEKAKSLGVPVYAIGVGPTAAVDLAVDLQVPPVMKKSERSSLAVTLRQTGLDDQTVTVNATVRRLDSAAGVLLAQPVGAKSVLLGTGTQTVDIPVTPGDAGRYEFAVEVKPLPGETVQQNNRAAREVLVLDDFLRLMFVEYEPTWEWRFVKEVFHRDPLVGMRGFRTFLRSADPTVRKNNELFLPTLTPARSEFFANDVIFLGDVPGEMLSAHFCEMVKEYVKTFGGGLVLIAGQDFGPEQLAATLLADLMPVVAEPGAKPVEKDFHLRLTAEAAQTDFMRLGNDERENPRAWDNLGPLPWYQPVSRRHAEATVLAEHPTDTCISDKNPQPLIAIRRYGRGEVVYLGFNEMWRLRKKFGELYYRQFWGQMIHRLGLSHALGSQKRFIVRTDRRHYQADDVAIVTIEAYDANFDPLTDKNLIGRKLQAELQLPDQAGEASPVQRLSISLLRDGIFETRLPVFRAGEHRIRVKDPITGEITQVGFQVAAVSAERRSAVRNVGLQEDIARSTGGKAYDLETASKLADEIECASVAEQTIKVFSLWDTWLVFLLVSGSLIGEWFFRKMENLP